MSADKDKWTEKLRHKLDSYEEPASESLWQSIERDVNANDIRRRMRRNVVRIASIAACFALITGSYVFLRHSNDNIATAPAMPQLPVAAAIPSSNRQTTPEAVAKQTERHIAASRPQKAAYAYNGNDSNEPLPEQSVASPSTESPKKETTVQHSQDKDKETGTPAYTGDRTYTRSYANDKRNTGKRPERSRFGVSVKVDNGFFAQNSSNGGFMPMDRQERPIFGPLYSSSKDDAAFNSSYAEMVANNTERPTRTDLQYDIPVTASAMFRYNISKRWSVDAGLSFTRTGASWRSGSESHYYRSKQKAYFIGIPASINFTIFDSRYFSFYALAGGSVEKCVAGNISTSLVGGLENSNPNKKEDLPEHPWQFSISAGVGLQFNITRQYSLFAEPKAAYYFDTAKDILLRKDNTPQFNLSVGMRFNY